MARFYVNYPGEAVWRFVRVEEDSFSFWTEGHPPCFQPPEEGINLGKTLMNTLLFYEGDESGFWAKYRATEANGDGDLWA